MFKKSPIVPKIGDHYVPTTSNQLTSDHSSSIELYSEGRCEDLESSDFTMPYDSCPPNMITGSSLDTSGTIDGRWMQFLSDDAFNFTPPPFPNYGSVSYPPSRVKFIISIFTQRITSLSKYFLYSKIYVVTNLQVDIALECARVQHRFSLPPLEVQDFPQAAGFTDFRLMSQSNPLPESANETDHIVQEILSVAQASQELINQSNLSDHQWGGNYTPDDDFSFMVVRDTANQVIDSSSERYIDRTWEDPSPIQIEDLDEDFKTQRISENLRWVGMSDEDLQKVLLYIGI